MANDQPARIVRAVDLIADERHRQRDKEGFTDGHDDGHADGAMLAAAGCYLDRVLFNRDAAVPSFWPWAAEWWKPTGDPVRDLVKAGALVAAEIDRLLRARFRDHADRVAAGV